MEFPSSTDNPLNGFILENKKQRKTREKHILYMAPVQETAMEKKATFWDRSKCGDGFHMTQASAKAGAQIA